MSNTSNGDYIFRCKLEVDAGGKPRRLSEFVQLQLESLLDIAILMEADKGVKVDGFRFIKDANKHKVFDHTRSVSPRLRSRESHILYEPRIEFIKRQCENLLSVIDLEMDGEVIKPDSFRLKSLDEWCVASSCDPNDIIDYLGSHCNCNCIMCCNRGNPPSLALSRRTTTFEEEYQELKTRAKYFSPSTYTGLFPSPGIVYEVLAHPYCLEILRLLRSKSSLPFRITTNGANLSASLISELSKLKPVYLYLSLNSSSPSRRKKLMNDPKPSVAINAPPLLMQEAISYAVTIVPWPMGSINEMLDDLTSTITYADGNMAHIIQINLPGYTKYFRPQPVADFNEIWRAIVGRVRELRDVVSCPVVVMPCMFEENIYEKKLGLPRIIGLVRNSPASVAGLIKNDIILEINGVRIRSRVQARELLSILQKSDNSDMSMVVRRGSDIIDIPIELNEYAYPYSKDTDNHIGIIFLGTGLANYTEKLKEMIQRHNVQRCLFLSSPLVKPTLEQQLGESNLLKGGDIKIDIETPRNKFFGGNIFMGDLLVVQDFIDCIKEYLDRAGQEPDLIVIPSSPFALGGWGRDLTGRVYLDIEREVGIPVELLQCEPIYE